MREIKFRAWDSQNKQMYDVHTLGLSDSKRSIIIKGNDSQTAREIVGEYPLMQFTDLLDKNGKEIYESDLVLINKKNWSGIKEVIWDDFFLCWTPKTLRTTKETIDFEIIGNIYENPELIALN